MSHGRLFRSLLILLVAALLFTDCAPQSQNAGAASGNGGQGNPPGNSPAVTPSPFQPQENAQPAATTQPAFFKGPLSVRINTIADNATVKQDTVTLGGTADDGTVISINDAIVSVGKSRQFNVTIKLDQGLNVLEITASDLQGNQDTAYLTINYDPNA